MNGIPHFAQAGYQSLTIYQCPDITDYYNIIAFEILKKTHLVPHDNTFVKIASLNSPAMLRITAFLY
uniref:Uncharacterized protein n=1 Tax=Anguilla anguilla TaxID=7936 RepID=A0A0E9RNH2_ANGAN